MKLRTLAIVGALIGAAATLGGQVLSRPLDRHIHGTTAEYYGKIVFICETRPREYCTADGTDCWLEADVYVHDTPCPKIRIK